MLAGLVSNLAGTHPSKPRPQPKTPAKLLSRRARTSPSKPKMLPREQKARCRTRLQATLKMPDRLDSRLLMVLRKAHRRLVPTLMPLRKLRWTLQLLQVNPSHARVWS